MRACADILAVGCIV